MRVGNSSVFLYSFIEKIRKVYPLTWIFVLAFSLYIVGVFVNRMDLFSEKALINTVKAQEFSCPWDMVCVVECSVNWENGCWCACDEPACFPEDTKISMSDGTSKDIEEVAVGDKVLSMSEDGRYSSSRVVDVLSPVSDNMCEIDFSDGESLKVTNSHPLYTTTGWKAIDVESAKREKESVHVQKLLIGDKLVKDDGTKPIVIDINCWDEKVQTYNLTVDNYHTYFADGFLAHNKGGGGGTCDGGGVNCPPGYTTAWNQPIATGCRNPTDNIPTQMCGTPGTAQQISGCCGSGNTDENGEYFCGNYQMSQYNCCPPGTVDTCTIVDQGSEYTLLRTYVAQYACSDDYDVFVSSSQSNVLERHYRTCDGEWDENTERCEGSMVRVDVYYYYTVCHDYARVCSCVSTCSAPTAPTLSSPEDGAQLSSTTVGLQWGASTFSSGCTGSYKVYVGTTNPPTTLYSTEASTVLSRNFTAGVRGQTYYWYVRAENGGVGANSAVRSFTILNDQITGQIFYDPNNTCSGSGWSTGGVSVSVDSGAGTAVSGTGTYTATAAIGASHTLDVSIPAGYACSTGVGCNTCSRSGIGSPSANNNFYLTDSREAWWQTEGAGIYAGGASGVRSILPSSSMKLILAPAGGTDALLITNSGSVDIGEGEVSDAGWRAISRYRGKTMDYNYFAANMGVVRGQESDWSVGEVTLGDYPAESDFGYMRPPAGTATITSPMVVTSPNQYVVFVDGDLEISADVTVEQGGFLAFVVNGSVTIDPAVTQLQGLYVIDDSFVTESQYIEGVTNDTPLAVEGTIVAWGSISIARDLGTGNITVPAEQFSYRPDLLTNMPDKMKTFVMQWSEVVPGTYDN